MAVFKLTRMKIITGAVLFTFPTLVYLLVLHRSASLEWILNYYGYALPYSIDSRESWAPLLRILPLHMISQILVISLPRREDRRKEMNAMKGTLHLDWTYIDAFDSSEPVIENILQQVRIVRKSMGSYIYSNETRNTTSFGNSDLWLHMSSNASTSSLEPLTCAKGDNIIPTYSPNLRQFEVLSRGMIACWLSHLMALRIAATEPKATMILEDDIDFDWDFTHIVNSNWHALPPSWDIVYLGYCWSNETRHPSLSQSSLIHPSHEPKCSHAYVVSPNGAQRILDLLRKTPFAFSRALDQALSHLIQKKDIESYSFVPSLVVQTKSSTSDIWEGNEFGSRWRENLTRSTRERLKLKSSTSSTGESDNTS